MSLFESFLGHAAGTGAQIIGDQMKNDTLLSNEKEVMKMREELAIEREKTTQALRRAQGLQAGQEINAEAEKIGKSRMDKDVQAKMAADPELNGMQPGDQEAIDNANPAQLKDAGLLSTFSRASKLDDRAAAAENLGYMDQAKEIRGQQQIENARASEERRTAAMDNQANNAARLADIKERDLARKEKDDKSDREMAEKRLLALVNKQSGANREEKVLSIVDSQRKELTQERKSANDAKQSELDTAAKEYREELKGAYGDPARIKELKTELESTRAGIEKKWEPKITELATKGQALDADYAYVRQKAGFPTKKTEPSAKVLTFDPKTGKFK